MKKSRGCWWLNGIWGYRCNGRVTKGPYCPMHNKLFKHYEKIRSGYEERKSRNALRLNERGGLRRLLKQER